MSLAYKISGLNRQRKYQKFLKYLGPTSNTTILDVGFNAEEYSAGDNFLEKNYPHPENITALGIDNPEQFLIRYPKVKALVYNGKSFPFQDKEFDIVWSNAVLEHVGSHNEQLIFLKEVNRVGKSFFITTPNKNFPIEVHTRTLFLHFLPKRIFDSYLKLIGKEWASGSYMNLLTKKRLIDLLAKAEIKNYTIIENRLGGLTIDFAIFKK
ncbi:MAG: methyltransferase domain-containing protein [Patescibacteria group bacterium]|jgi:SAM-dependent methyltransferase